MKQTAFRLDSEQLTWKINPQQLTFKTTKDIKPNRQVYGHDTAKAALTYAIECQGKGLNAYLRGLSGSGRKTLLEELFKQIRPKARIQRDFCYLHNFSHPNAPRLIILKAGYGKILKRMLSAFADYVESDLSTTLNDEKIKNQRKNIEKETNKIIAKHYGDFENKLDKLSLALANVEDEQGTRMVIAPIHKGKILTPEALDMLLQEGKFSSKTLEKIENAMPELQEELQQIAEKTHRIVENSSEKIRSLNNAFTRQQLNGHLLPISKKFTNPELDNYLAELVDDFIDNQLHSQDKDFDPIKRYGVNILSPRFSDDNAPIVIESAPTLSNLLGAVETEGQLLPYQSISAGSLLKADGGFLVVEVDDALSENGSWATLMRTLRTAELSFAFENKANGNLSLVKPQSIPLDIKVILIGSHQRFYELQAYDADFSNYFKVLADMDTELSREQESYLQYAKIVRKIVDNEQLLHFERSAVAALIEHGARLVGGKDKLSARFGQVMDSAREAAYLAKKSSAKFVEKEHVNLALAAARKRNFAAAKHFYALLDNGTIRIDTAGCVVGQINGLAVTSSGTLDYGFPARVTATLAPGKMGLINIEGQAALSGQIHTKGFQILGGLLRYLLLPEHPLSFSASIAFEQSYGGIDGDSASGAEACCLLSALTGIGIKQELAMTGAIDQFGHLQAIGGVNEKIEGFFNVCHSRQLTGEQGVIIPAANVGELMLPENIVEASSQGLFHLYAVDHVLDALSILTDTPSCKTQLATDRKYHKDSLLAIARQKAQVLYQQSKGQ